MGFHELTIESEYRSFRNDVVESFFIPVLERAVLYKRAVGFFSSSALIELTKGITGLVKNNGRIQLITSPHLSEEDYEAIKTGYIAREKLLALLQKQLHAHKTHYEKERLNLLANLIKDEVLDIRIAFTRKNTRLGMYHEKMGVIQDNVGERIAFSGSLNESSSAFNLNYESFDVFRSWINEDEARRVNRKADAFDRIWHNQEPFMETVEIPEIKEEVIRKYLYKNPNLQIDDDEFSAPIVVKKASHIHVRTPDDITFYDYQVDAIDAWENASFTGIFDMATGTGKTLTALGAIVRIFTRLEGKLAVVIACPFQHLVEQWVEDIRRFGIEPIIGYSKSSQRDWRTKLSNAVLDYKLDLPDRRFFCLVTTNATFRTDFVQAELRKIKRNALVVIDEAHNFGSELLRAALPGNFEYRLALSATIERHGDEAGTKALLDYFGQPCIQYTLGRAIKEKKLTPYLYHPVLVTLTLDEIERYVAVSRQIRQCVIQGKNGKTALSEHGKRLLIKRARIVAGAWNKIPVLEEYIVPYQNESHILVYCGAATTLNPDLDETPVDDDELRQISQVTDLLGNSLSMKVSQFTSREDIEERKILKEKFANGDMLQALIAIKCLDEGVNIPKIKTAFILASTTNPKEYIQRRGRVLRLAPGKEIATIFDFITVPYTPEEMYSLTNEQIEWFRSLIRNELARGFEFAELADNQFAALSYLSELQDAYDVSDLTFSISGEQDGFEQTD